MEDLQEGEEIAENVDEDDDDESEIEQPRLSHKQKRKRGPCPCHQPRKLRSLPWLRNFIAAK